MYELVSLLKKDQTVFLFISETCYDKQKPDQIRVVFNSSTECDGTSHNGGLDLNNTPTCSL